MTVEFAHDQTVNTKYGVGKITYVEDGYMDVVVKGKEYNFFEPFDGKVWAYTPPPSKDQIFDEILARPDMTSIINLSKINHHGMSFVMSLLHGSSADWDELTSNQKMNHIAITSGTPVSFWLEAYKEGKLDVLIARFTGSEVSK